MSRPPTVFRFAVEYLDSLSTTKRDVFETLSQAKRRQAYLAQRGRPATIWQV